MPAEKQQSHHDYLAYRDQVVSVLENYPNWDPLKKTLKEGLQFVPWFTNTPAIDVRHIVCREGHGCQRLDDIVIDTTFQAYLERVLQPLLVRGEITDGSSPGTFDDRKLRWSTTNLEKNLDIQAKTLTLEVGPTWFQQCKIDIQRDPLEALKLMFSGLKNYGDPYAYFARGIGIVAIPRTKSGHVFLGRRANTAEYSNYFCFVSGWATFFPQITQIDFYADLEQELREEIHLDCPLHRAGVQFAGIAGHPLTGEVDLVFVIQTDLSDDYFAGNLWPEHSDWHPVRNLHDAQKLLKCGISKDNEKGYNLVFSSRFGLEFLVKHYWTT